MEFPHSRPLENQGKNATQDFLSLYSSPVQQDPTPPQGGYLKTHEFLPPLEIAEKNATKEENKVGTTAIEKPLPQPSTPSVAHLLSGGIGTYTMSYFNQKVLKPEASLLTAQASSTTGNNENSNSSSHSGSGFTFWDESAVKQGKTGKENLLSERHALQEAGMNVVGGRWPSVLEKQSQLSSTHKPIAVTFSSVSSSQPSSSPKKQSFMEMITSAKHDQEEDEDDDEDEEFNVKKWNSSNPEGNLPIKVEAKSIDQKPNTPRSKHSATEQRRRSKINDRFQKLREIIPNSEQKRDKASFLLEVIEYIQFLQEKANKHEHSYNVWNHEPPKIMQWKNSPIAEGYIDPGRGIITRSGPASVVAAKFDEAKTVISRNITKCGQNLVESDIRTSKAVPVQIPVRPDEAKTVISRNITKCGQNLVESDIRTAKAVPVQIPVRPNIFTFARPNIATSPISVKSASDNDKTASWPTSQIIENRLFTDNSTGTGDNKLKDQEMTVESGTINISSVYSSRLLNTLTQALQSSGVDLSQANISVQIDLGKTSAGNNSILNSSTSNFKEDEVAPNLARSRVANTEQEFNQAVKRLKTS